MYRVVKLVVIILSFFLFSCRKKSNKELAHSYYRLAMLEVSQDHLSCASYRKALSYIKKANDLEPTATYLALQGTILLRLGDYNASVKLCEKALEIAQGEGLITDIKNNLACSAAALGDFNRAQRLWDQLARDDGYLTPEVALVNQGKLYIAQKQYDQARELFNKAITLAPHYTDAYFYAALVAYHLKDTLMLKDRLATLRFMDPRHQGADLLDRLME